MKQANIFYCFLLLGVRADATTACRVFKNTLGDACSERSRRISQTSSSILRKRIFISAAAEVNFFISASPLIAAALLRSLAECLRCLPPLPPLSRPLPPRPHSILETNQTNPSLWVLQLPVGRGAVGGGTGSLAVMKSSGTAVQFHHSKNCSHGAANTVKTNKSKYLELIAQFLGAS